MLNDCRHTLTDRRAPCTEVSLVPSNEDQKRADEGDGENHNRSCDPAREFAVMMIDTKKASMR